MDALQWSVSAMRAARDRLDIATGNLANSASDGFAKSVAHVSATATGLVTASRPETEPPPLRRTGRPLDLAIAGAGALPVTGGTTRGDSFRVDADGFIADSNGRRLLARCGPVRASETLRFESDGTIRDGERVIDRISLPSGARLETGMRPGTNVDAIGEMVHVLDAQRAFETAQKTLMAADTARAKDANDVGRLK